MQRATVSFHKLLCRSYIWSCFGWGLQSLSCYHGSGELLPRLSTLTRRHGAGRRYISVALFLKSPSAGVTRYPCPVEPGLSSWTDFRPVPATIQRTRRVNSTQTAAESQRKFTERGGSAAFYPVPFPPPTGSPRESAPRRCGTALPHPTESLPAPDAA